MDRTAGFVAHDERLLRGDVRIADAAFRPEVHVAAAGADVVDADYHIGGIGDLGDGVVGKFGGAGALEPNCWVLDSCISKSIQDTGE